MTDTTELRKAADLVELIQGLCCLRAHGCEVNDADECPAQRVREALVSLQRERDEATQHQDRLMLVMADIREASGVGMKPMLGDVPEAIRDKISGMEAELSRLRSEVERATGHVRNLVNERGCPSCGGAPTNAKRAARDFLNGLGGEG